MKHSLTLMRASQAILLSVSDVESGCSSKQRALYARLMSRGSDAPVTAFPEQDSVAYGPEAVKISAMMPDAADGAVLLRIG